MKFSNRLPLQVVKDIRAAQSDEEAAKVLALECELDDELSTLIKDEKRIQELTDRINKTINGQKTTMRL